MKFSDISQPQLSESFDCFKDVDTIKIDPDRADAHDLVNKILPSLVKMAYCTMVEKHKKVEKTRDPDDEDDQGYELSVENLIEHTEDWLSFFKEKLSDLSDRDYKRVIDNIKSEFPLPLVK